MLCLSAAPVNDKRKLLKSEKADSKRQQDVFHSKIRMEDKIDILKKEIVILKIKQ